MNHTKHSRHFSASKIILFLGAFYCCFLFFQIQNLYSQNVLIWQIDSQKIRSKKANDSLVFEQFIIKKQNQLLNKGYLNLHVDTVQINSDSLYLRYSRNHKYYWGNLNITNQNYTSSRNIKKLKTLHNKTANPEKLYNQKKSIIESLEDNGYPFAKITFDSNKIGKNRIHLDLSINPGKLIRYDSLKYNENLKISYLFLTNYLNIKYFEPYSEKDIREINKKIQKLRFLELNSPFLLNFNDEKAQIKLNLKERKSNQFNGIIGFQPNQENNTLQFTGQFYLKILNTFRIADFFEFEWNKLEQNSQELITNLAFPYIFLGDFGISGMLHIEKFDTLYVRNKSNISINYTVSSSVSVRANSKFFNSNVLTTSNLGNYSNFSSKFLGLGLTINTLNNELSPRNGFVFSVDINTGEKNMPDSTLSLKNIEYLSNFSYPLKVTHSLVFNYSYDLGIIENKRISENEMFKLGGLKTIRGFNEKSIISPSYLLQTLEANYYMESNSKVFLFYDIGLTNVMENKSFQSNKLYGIGTGITIETKAGLFSLIYALGKTNSSNFQLKEAKIHFGYISQF